MIISSQESFPGRMLCYTLVRKKDESGMIDYFRNRYVPERLIREWADDSGNVLWYNPFNRNYKTGKSKDFFRDKITGLAEDEIEYMKMLDDEISSLGFLSDLTQFNELQNEDPIHRSSVLFSYMRTPSYQLYSEGIDGSMVNLKGGRVVPDGRRSGKYMSKLLQIIASGELSIMDLTCTTVYSYHRRFLLPSSPLNMINPYLGDNLAGDSVNLNPFILKGAFFILPASPDNICVIYDKSVYRLLTGEGRLSDKDVDTINMIGLYNGGEDGGVVCKQWEDGYVDLLVEKMDGRVRGRETYTRLDTYPFSTGLSFIRCYSDAEKEREENTASPVRKLAAELQKYDEKKMKNVTEADYEKKMHKRYLFARSLISK